LKQAFAVAVGENHFDLLEKQGHQESMIKTENQQYDTTTQEQTQAQY